MQLTQWAEGSITAWEYVVFEPRRGQSSPLPWTASVGRRTTTMEARGTLSSVGITPTPAFRKHRSKVIVSQDSIWSIQTVVGTERPHSLTEGLIRVMSIKGQR